MPATAYRPFAAPADLTPDVLAHAEALWASTIASADEVFVDATDRRLAQLPGLGPGDGHDELTRCEAPGCDAWFWVDCGATVAYESDTELTVCPQHAQADDPGARVYPGSGLLAVWEAQRDAEESRRIRTTGRPW